MGIIDKSNSTQGVHGLQSNDRCDIDLYRAWCGILGTYATKVLNKEFEQEIIIDSEENTVSNMT
jgi:hypothetical protein